MPPKRRRPRKPRVQHPKIKDWLADCPAHNLPEPVRELKFHPVRRWRFDYAWPDYMVALEVDGGGAWGRHGRPSGMSKDNEKINTAQTMGWIVLRCLYSERDRVSVMDGVRAALAARGYP